MDRLTVRPKSGMRIRFEDPARGHIPADGAEVPSTSYYRRRMKDGDLMTIPVNPAKPAKGT